MYEMDKHGWPNAHTYHMELGDASDRRRQVPPQLCLFQKLLWKLCLLLSRQAISVVQRQKRLEKLGRVIVTHWAHLKEAKYKKVACTHPPCTTMRKQHGNQQQHPHLHVEKHLRIPQIPPLLHIPLLLLQLNPQHLCSSQQHLCRERVKHCQRIQHVAYCATAAAPPAMQDGGTCCAEHLGAWVATEASQRPQELRKGTGGLDAGTRKGGTLWKLLGGT